MQGRLIRRFVFAVLLLTVTVSNAQTVSSGPYYATPSWDQKLQCDTQTTCPRFIVLSNWNNAAVLDRETGVVWERSPLAPCVSNPPLVICPVPESGRRNWADAQFHCNTKVAAGSRSGWRLPTVQELRSLVDFDNASSPKLPPGHPFIGVQLGYWTATSRNPGDAYTVILTDGHSEIFDKTEERAVWCVRGGQGVDFQ